MTGPQTLSRPLAARLAGLAAAIAEAQAEPAITLPQQIIDAAVDALNRGETHYTDRPGIKALRQVVSTLLFNKYGIDIATDEVTITAGATEARFAAIRLLARPGSQLICPAEWASVAGVAQLAGARMVAAAEDPAQGSMVYLTPEDPRSLVDRLLEQAGEYGWWIAWDISQATTSATYHPAQQGALAARVVTIGSWETQLPGWRVGWMAGSEAAQKLRAFKQSMTICTTNVSQWAALALTEAT